jgi:hypothetical protein
MTTTILKSAYWASLGVILVGGVAYTAVTFGDYRTPIWFSALSIAASLTLVAIGVVPGWYARVRATAASAADAEATEGAKWKGRKA